MAIERWVLGLALGALTLGSVGCANLYRAPFKPAPGAFITTQTIPLTTDFSVPCPVGMKKETSETFYLWWPYPIMDFSWGEEDLALGKLARKGAKPRYAELEVFTVLGLFGRYTVNIYH